MGKSTISMAIFHCYVSSPEGTMVPWPGMWDRFRIFSHAAVLADTADGTSVILDASVKNFPGWQSHWYIIGISLVLVLHHVTKTCPVTIVILLNFTWCCFPNSFYPILSFILSHVWFGKNRSFRKDPEKKLDPLGPRCWTSLGPGMP